MGGRCGCGNKSYTRNEAGEPTCRPCLIGKNCENCRLNVAYHIDDHGRALCKRCAIGSQCSYCSSVGAYKNPNIEGEYVCGQHRKYGPDYEPTRGTDRTRHRVLYVVDFKEQRSIKVGIGYTNSRHQKWVSGGASVLRLFELDGDPDVTPMTITHPDGRQLVNGQILNYAETRWKKSVTAVGFQNPTGAGLPAVIDERNGGKTEVFSYADEDERIYLAYGLVDDAVVGLPIRETDAQ